MKNPFVVSEEALAALPEDRAEDLVRRMIAAEADSAGVRPDGIYDGGRASSPDGGIDFEVRDAPRESAGGLIKRGRTLYQVRSGRLSPTRDVRGILFKKDGALRDPIRGCLEGGGTLAVVLTGWGGSSTAGSGLEDKFTEALRGMLPPSEARVLVWTPARIRSLLERHPHLALFANSWYPEGLRAHDAWSRLADMSHAFKPGGKEDQFVRRLRERLLGDKPLHLRVTGEPGSGKTRLVLEATRDERLRGRVVYADGPLLVRQLLNHVNMGGTGGTASSILVVDDCSRSEQAGIWNELKNSSRIRLVTIHSEADENRADTVHMPVPPLADAQLSEIISTYTGAGRDVAAWVKYCRASPRAAHIVGANLRDNPDYMLLAPSTVAVWDRYIAGQNDPHGDEFRERKTVLSWLSLFKTFGHGDAYGHELDRIAELVEKNAHMSKDRLVDTIHELRRMKVLQGTSTLYITPKLLHIHMWVEWWNKHPPSMAPGADQLAGRGEGGAGSQSLLQRYLDMFHYARDSPEASKVVKRMLLPGGLLDSDEALKSQLGADFFLTVSSVDPASTLACIERIAGRPGAGPAGALGGAHQGVAHALAQALSHEGSFGGAMRLLLRLAVAGGGADAARAHGPVPPLEAYCRALDPSNEAVSAPLSARLSVLSEAAQSASAEERRVAVLACASVLSMRRRSIAVPRCRGFERVPDPWTPRDRGEAAGYCLGVFGLLRAAALDPKGGRVRGEAAAAAVETAHQAALVPGLSLPVADLLGGLAASGAADRALILDKAALLLDAERDRIGPRAAEALSSLRDSMEGSGLSAELRRRVGRHARGGWGAEDEEEENDREAAALGDLADRAVRGGAILAELDWLVADGAVNGLAFGREVAGRDPDLALLDPILEAMRAAGPSATALFLSGYLLPLAEGRRGDLERLLDRMLADAALRARVPEVTWRTGVTERAVKRLTAGVLDRALGLGPMQVFRYGHRLRGAGAGAVAGLAGAVLERCGGEDGAGATALDMLHSYFVAGPKRGAAAAAAPLPEGLALETLLHRDFDGAADCAPPDHVACAAWKELAAALARRGGAPALALAEAMIDRFGDSALLHAPGPEPPSAALAEIAAGRPREVWAMIAARLDPPLGQRARRLLEWIEEGGGSKTVGAGRLTAALMPWIIAWVGEDPDGRAGRVAGHLPPIFSAIRGFAARFGDREDVRDGLAGRFAAGPYRGSLVSHCADKRRWALDASKAEGDPNVLSFLGRYVRLLEAQMGLEAPAEGGGIAAA